MAEETPRVRETVQERREHIKNTALNAEKLFVRILQMFISDNCERFSHSNEIIDAPAKASERYARIGGYVLIANSRSMAGHLWLNLDPPVL